MSHVAHEACGVDVFLCFSPQSNQCSSVAAIAKQRCSTREIIYQTSDNIDFSTNWYESIPVQILRAKIFIPIIDEQWYSSFWCSWMLLFALEHQSRHSLPLIMPVILPSYGERASEVLIAQLTKNYKATVMLSDREPIEQSLEAFFKLIELTIHTPEWLLQGLKSKRYVDNNRPLTYNELHFLNDMRHKEIVLMRDMSLQQERKLPTSKPLMHNQHVALSIPYEQLPSFLLSAVYENYHITWFDVVTIDRQHYFTFIWNDNHLFQNRTSVMFYDLNPAQFHELTLKMNRYQFDLIHFDVYRHSSENMLRYICLYIRQDLIKSFHKLRTAVIAHRWLNETNHHAFNIRPHLLCGNLYYSNLVSPKRSSHDFFYRINLTDLELLEEHAKALTDNFKLIDLKVYHLKNGDYRFVAMWTNQQEGTSMLYIGLTYDELVARLNEKQLRTAIITNYGLLVDGQQCFALVCNQYGSVW
ncbi:unnamed protein product [Rotaria socialis]|uniref:Uncharacterized protein n=2 Tax=Rotaria socialis TaxID=392032 RepID=A0A818NS93_9BILA|nr:unnamed protein product [Rotaria socialis]CAF3448892.1 unnamed protein product [Rotaria socialis]CAF3571212.1 unnamed protein product [Rotaria socialis]CAF3609304.1 unnamed protein product [Rotaria socialis]CAF4328184.1 unnamed protein product [Rotaria socialis]